MVQALNLPVTIGEPRATYDRGWIVVADAIASTYLDALITGVDDILVDSRVTADLAGDDITD